ncbi:hypothetical protein HZH66_006862 [Vespula vulgaris]|uniref:Uncharacterized protein n=1 Tax=Vespula vulgaris TaxID=7454 RepID=A0A834K343_VESVU|nr:hypothetical protein HZH66_006862 [Vespula vulgaris]
MVRSSEQTLNASDDGKQRPPGRRSTEESFSFRENLKDAYVKISRLMGMSSTKQIYKVFTSPWKNSKDTSVYYSLTEAETTYPTLDSQPHARVARMGPVFQVNQSPPSQCPSTSYISLQLLHEICIF